MLSQLGGYPYAVRLPLQREANWVAVLDQAGGESRTPSRYCFTVLYSIRKLPLGVETGMGLNLRSSRKDQILASSLAAVRVPARGHFWGLETQWAQNLEKSLSVSLKSSMSLYSESGS